jgi:ribonucleoside-triphosphate reductase
MNIKKRDGRLVPFEKGKIEIAINKAFLEVDGLTNDEVTVAIADWIEDNLQDETGVEEIQDNIQRKLIESGCQDVAIAYIRYRYLHEMARKSYNDLMSAVSEKIQATNVQNQNANVDEHSFGGRIGEMSDLVMKRYALDYCVSPMARVNHENNEIYIHDLNSYAVGSHNCLSLPFDDLLAKGFDTRQTDVRPAQSISTAMQLIAVIFQIQSLNQFGGVASTHLDWTMVPYVRKSFRKHYINGLKYFCDIDDKELFGHIPEDAGIEDEEYKIYDKAYKYSMDMTKKECYQAVEAMFHNLNTLQSRSGCQLPFTSINYGTCILPEGRMITKAILDISIKGIGKLHRTSVFPCQIFQCMKGVNRKPEDPNYDLFQLALKSTALRLYPNYCNVDWSVNIGYDKNDPKTYVSTMGCRTYNGFDINAEPGVNPQTKDGRGNICPVTIIMPTLAMEAKEEYNTDVMMDRDDKSIIDLFFGILDKKIHEAKDMLLERFEWICAQPPEAASFMYENNTMTGYHPEEGIRSALKHGTLAIGQIGLAETLQILIGKDHTTEYGMDLAKRIEKLFQQRCAEFKKEYHLNFGVYMTPAENLCYTSMEKFKEKYGIIENVSDKDYFTNSIHIPVWKKISPIDKIDIESQLTGYSNAGCITYIELESGIKNNLEALETIVNYAMDKDIPYFAVNVPNDQCMNCGYCDEIGTNCPACGGKNIKRLRRVTGYLTNDYKTAFNLGKQQEVEMRERHDQIEVDK